MKAGQQIDTNSALRDWEEGNSRAERLAASILFLDGYKDIDPQHPRGGPDGRKDMLCTKGAKRYVVAVYFPYADLPFADTEKKFQHDLKGAIAANVDGIVFVTNQYLTQAQRRALNSLAAAEEKLCEPFHRERIRVLLDSPACRRPTRCFLSKPTPV